MGEAANYSELRPGTYPPCKSARRPEPTRLPSGTEVEVVDAALLVPRPEPERCVERAVGGDGDRDWRRVYPHGICAVVEPLHPPGFDFWGDAPTIVDRTIELDLRRGHKRSREEVFIQSAF